MIFNCFKNRIDNLYYINFQFNGEFYKIRIYCNIIHNWSTIDHLIRWSILKFPYLLCVPSRTIMWVSYPQMYDDRNVIVWAQTALDPSIVLVQLMSYFCCLILYSICVLKVEKFHWKGNILTFTKLNWRFFRWIFLYWVS
jgi:hypothetical protein